MSSDTDPSTILTGRKASNARMQQACTLLAKRIMGNTRTSRWVKKNYKPVAPIKKYEVEKVSWLKRLDNWWFSLFRRT